ncbi:MAG: HAD family hydrolase [Flavihumibacter sp.]
MFLLASDLDGTFLGGDRREQERLYRLIVKNPAVTLVFVTGRGMGTVMPLLEDPFIPQPHYIIADVGATVVDGSSLEPIEPLHTEIEKRWPGSDAVKEKMAGIGGLRLQPVPMGRRVSYFLDPGIDITEIEDRAGSIGCDVIFSAGRYIDVLPGGVNKGVTLKHLMEMLHVPDDEVLVAGDTLNDLSLFQTGYRGVVVGGAEPQLIEATAGQSQVFQAERLGAGGILQALHHYNTIPDGI